MKITDLQPKLIWECFDEITRIPRPTHNLDKMRDFLMSWAKRHNIPAEYDSVGNVKMTKPATPGYENAPVVILQGHQDMVAEKRSDKKHDFLNDPITTIVDGDWVKADGTTLGADNGLGCAAAMAVLIDNNLIHGPIECLFTVDEEQGLIGANGLKSDFVKGEILLNLDSEEHGSLVIGCAGGKVTICKLPYEKVETPARKEFFTLHLNNFKGGHSGMEINLCRGNANQQMSRFIWSVWETLNPCIASFNGGGLANAIPREAIVVIGIDSDKKTDFLKKVVDFDKLLHEEFSQTEDASFYFKAEPSAIPEKVIAQEIAYKLVSAVFACPNGVQQMSAVVEGLVETSCNLASVKTEEKEIIITVHQRSSVDSRRDEIADRIKALFELIGCNVTFDDTYVGWSPNPDSRILNISKQSFTNLFGFSPKVEALHAGLECGLFLEKMPGLDMISFGPTLKDIHSPNEKAYIPSVKDFWTFLCDILKRIAEIKK